RPDAAGRCVRAPPCVPGGCAAHLARGLEVREIAPQHAALDEDPRRGGDTFAVERRAAESALPPSVINDRDACVRDALADLSREQRPALQDAVGGEERS